MEGRRDAPVSRAPTTAGNGSNGRATTWADLKPPGRESDNPLAARGRADAMGSGRRAPTGRPGRQPSSRPAAPGEGPMVVDTLLSQLDALVVQGASFESVLE